MSQILPISTKLTKGITGYLLLITALCIAQWSLRSYEAPAQSVQPAQTYQLNVTIRLVDAETDTTITSANVRATDEKTGQNLPIGLDSLGFKLSALPGTSLIIQASAPAYFAAKTRIINLAVSQRVIMKLTHTRPSVVMIKAFAEHIGQPLSSATAVITSEITGKSERFTLKNGRLEQQFTQPDKLDIQISSPGYTPVSRQLSIEVPPTGKRYEFDVELDKILLTLTIRAVDSQTGKPISGGRFTLNSADGTAPSIPTSDPETGSFNATLPDKGVYQLVSTTEGYEKFTRSLTIDKEQNEVLVKLVAKPTIAELKPAVVHIEAKPTLTETGSLSVSAVTTKSFGVIEKGKSIRLNKIYFDQSSPVLRSQSYTELDQLYDVLTQYPSLRIEIRGHTDNQGELSPNIQLSRDRCQAVVDYLAKKGIRRTRLNAVGRGPLDPVAPNNNEENRKKNRRVEFVLL